MVEQPHFDDELTVLTAQPVVPLAQIKHRRRWFLGGAFAIAMLLGAASAVVSAYFRLRHLPDQEIQTSSVSPPLPEPAVESAAPPVESMPPVVEVVAERPRPKPRSRDNKIDRVVIDPRLSDDEALRRIRDSVLIDEWQERRMRRVERRERRRAQHHDRDLSNINEIFEGTRRP